MSHTLGCVALTLMAATGALADDLTVAVAANFAAPMKALSADFEKDSGHKLVVSVGATGKFYAQIKNGAPFEVLLAADDETPARLVKEGAAVSGTAFTYAIGRLVLWSTQPGLVDADGAVLKGGPYAHLAIADPRLAPYGVAAVETMKALGVHDALARKFVTAENIGQAHQFVSTGNAELGFVALSQVLKDGRIDGSSWLVPARLHTPILQDAVVLDKGRGRPAAAALMKYLQSDKAKAVIRSFGYALP